MFYMAGLGRILAADLRPRNPYVYAKNCPPHWIDADGADDGYVDEKGVPIETFGPYTLEDFFGNTKPTLVQVPGSGVGNVEPKYQIKGHVPLPDSPVKMLTLVGDCSEDYNKLVQSAVDDFKKSIEKGLVDKNLFVKCGKCTDYATFVKLTECMKSRLAKLKITCKKIGGIRPIPIVEGSGALPGGVKFTAGETPPKPGYEITLFEDAERGKYKASPPLVTKKRTLQSFVTETLVHELSHTCGTVDPDTKGGGFSSLPFAEEIWTCIQKNIKK